MVATFPYDAAVTASERTPDVPGPSAEPAVIQEGARFGDLTLLRQLGRGNQGVVWEAHQKSLERRIAVKILPRDSNSSEELVERFHREAEAAGRLSHASIVAVYGFAELGGHRLILQELATGGSLEALIEQRHKAQPATTREDCRWAAEVCRQLAEALHHAHQHNVIHRDIKPGNVLLSADGVPKIADFGLARVEDLFELSQTGALMGTPHYMSPEQVSAKQQGIDARTDVYSLGAMLYRMVARQVPFSGDSLQKIFMDILTREPKPPRKLQPAIDADLEAVCLKALEKAPERRYATARAFGEDLQRFLRGEPTLARPVGPLGRLARSLGHLATSTLVVVALLVPTAWFAVDALLEGSAAAGVRRHDWRFGVAGLATLLLCWPLAHIATRLAHARRWAVAPACLLALLLGGAAGWSIREQKTGELHHADRATLARQIRLETVGQVKSVADIDRYIEAWGPRFDGDDFMLVARGYLKRERPVRAGEWATRLLTENDRDPVHQALLVAVEAALGDEPRMRAAEQVLHEAEASITDSATWEQVGNILLDMRRFARAATAFQTAGSLPNANRDLLNLELAQAAAGLCSWDEADESLHDFMKWSPNDPAALLLAVDIAIARRNWDAAETFVARMDGSSQLPRATRLGRQSAVLYARLGIPAAGDLMRRTEAGAGSDPELLKWCGDAAYELSQSDVGNAVSWLELMRDCYARLLGTGQEQLVARVGLAAADIQLALQHFATDPAAAGRRLDDAVEQSQEAIALDPAFFESHHNLGTALLYKALLAHDFDERALTVEELSSVVAAMQSSLQYNGLQALTLNDTANALRLHFERDKDSAHLRDALVLVQRAIGLRQPAEGSRCGVDGPARAELSACYDTLAGIQEQLGDAEAAVAAADLALSSLRPGDEARDKRAANAERLRNLLAGR